MVPIEQKDGTSQYRFPHAVYGSASGSAYSFGGHHCHEKNLVSFYFASPIILCASNSVCRFKPPLLPLGSTDFLGNFDGGNKTKTIANLDQKIRRIPSKTVLRLNLRSPTRAISSLLYDL